MSVNKTINQLPFISFALSGDEEIPIWQNGITSKATVTNLSEYIVQSPEIIANFASFVHTQPVSSILYIYTTFAPIVHSHSITAVNELIYTGSGNTFLSDNGTYRNLTSIDVSALPVTGGTLNKLNFNNYENTNPIEGDVWWNSEFGTLNIKPDINGPILQVGQEQWIRVFNNTGIDIVDGKAVYISSANFDEPEVALASSNSQVTAQAIGVTTSIIRNGEHGFVTVSGIVHDFDTSTFSPGNRLYLTNDSTGNLTNIAPSSPFRLVRLGYVLNRSITGSIYVETQPPLSTDYNLVSSNALASSSFAVKTYIDTKFLNTFINSKSLSGNVNIGISDISTLQATLNSKQATGTPYTASQYKLTAFNIAPSGSNDTGEKFEIRITENAMYVCTDTNIWVKTDLTTW
jgi:hypothetical protein